MFAPYLNPALMRPGWVFANAVFDIDFINRRSYGAPQIWANQTSPQVGSMAMGNNFQACFLPDATGGGWTSYVSGGTFIVPGRGMASFGNTYFPFLQNCNATNSAWTKSNMTTARITGPDGVANSGSRLTATANAATISQAVVTASDTFLCWVVIKRVTGTGNISLSIDAGVTNTVLTTGAAWAAQAIPQQTLANPTCMLTMATSGDVVDIMWLGANQQIAGVACPKEPGAAITTTTTATQWFGTFSEINNGRGGGGYANGALGERWPNAMNSGQAAIYVQWVGNPPSGTGLVAATDGPGFIANFAPGSPITFATSLTSSNNANANGVTNRAMEGYQSLATAGGNAPNRGCLNGGPIASGSANSGAPSATHMVLGSQGSQALSINGYIERIAGFDHVPPDTSFVNWTTAPA